MPKKRRTGSTSCMVTFEHENGVSCIGFTWKHNLSDKANVAALAQLCIDHSISYLAADAFCRVLGITLERLCRVIKYLQYRYRKYNIQLFFNANEIC